MDELPLREKGNGSITYSGPILSKSTSAIRFTFSCYDSALVILDINSWKIFASILLVSTTSIFTLHLMYYDETRCPMTAWLFVFLISPISYRLLTSILVAGGSKIMLSIFQYGLSPRRDDKMEA